MLNENWKTIKKLKEHKLAKNKNLKAIHITEENVERLSKETDCFTVIRKGLILAGILQMESYPCWIICINPKGKANQFIFEPDSVFETCFEIEMKDN